MPPTHNRYQRYAERLGEPVTDDLKDFVDGLDAPYLAAPLPETLRHFTPSAHSTDEELLAMSLPPPESTPVVTRHIPPHDGDRSPRSRVSFGLVAAIVFVVVVVSIFATKQVFAPQTAQRPQTTSSPTASPIPTATPQPPATKVYVRCLTISLQEPTSPATNCDAVPPTKSVPINSLVNLLYCYTADIPLPSAIAAKVTYPDGKSSIASGGLLVGQPPCDGSGTHVDQTGQYTVQIYWNPATNLKQPIRQPIDPVKDHTWQLQITELFTVI
ncbi:MAG: hypothetical protein H0X24_08500 [Ktedonobacterales bacterium]|nr:hypothetical protein [Ktedonobacterales bacterium]